MKKHLISSRELKRARTAKAIVGAVKDFISRGMLLTLILAPAAQAADLIINDAVEGQITLTHDATWRGVVSNQKATI
jgi:hypothetical protein